MITKGLTKALRKEIASGTSKEDLYSHIDDYFDDEPTDTDKVVDEDQDGMEDSKEEHGTIEDTDNSGDVEAEEIPNDGHTMSPENQTPEDKEAHQGGAESSKEMGGVSDGAEQNASPISDGEGSNSSDAKSEEQGTDSTSVMAQVDAKLDAFAQKLENMLKGNGGADSTDAVTTEAKVVDMKVNNGERKQETVGVEKKSFNQDDSKAKKASYMKERYYG